MNDTVIIDAIKWHRLCSELNLDEWGGANGRKEAFEDYFNCTVTWKSRLINEQTEPYMALRFLNPHDAVVFSLKWL